jgi:hypothetical protein
MAKNETGSCPLFGGCDKLSCLLSKVGINRSLLITLGLLPFAWNGVVFLKNFVVSVWSHLSTGLTTAFGG